MTSKLAAILRTFSSGRAHSLSDVARSADIPVSTAHRLVTELVEFGLLDRSADKRYCVGSLLTQIGTDVWPVPHIRSQAEQVLDDLSAAVHATVRFAVLQGNSITCLERRPTTKGPVRTDARQLPVHATAAGKVLLAFSEPATTNDVVRRGLPRYTDATIVAGSALRRELTLARMSQLAWSRGELEPTTWSIATPVFARGGQVVAALEVSVTGSAAQHRMPAVQPALVVAGRALSRQFALNQASPGRRPVGIGAIDDLATIDSRLA